MKRSRFSPHPSVSFRGVYVGFRACPGTELVSIAETCERTETGEGPEFALVLGAFIWDFGDGGSPPGTQHAGAQTTRAVVAD